MKTEHERNKQLEFLRAYTNPNTRFICFSGGRHSGQTFFKQLLQAKYRAKNYLIQERNAHKQLNLMLQINFVDVEIKAIASAIKNGTYPDIIMVDEPTAVIPPVKITKTTACGSSYSANCPKCGKTKILSGELNTMTAVCNKCYTSFKLEK